MNDVAYESIEDAVANRRTRLSTLSRPEVATEFESVFQIRPDARSTKEDLIERILAKVQAELRRRS